MAILTREVLPAAAEAQAARIVADPFRERLIELLEDRHGFVAKEDLWHALGRKDAAGRTQAEMNVLTNTMTDLGWATTKQRRNGQNTPAYKRTVPGLKPEWVHLIPGQVREIIDYDDISVEDI